MPSVITVFLRPEHGAELYFFCCRNAGEGVYWAFSLKHCVLLLRGLSVQHVAQTSYFIALPPLQELLKSSYLNDACLTRQGLLPLF